MIFLATFGALTLVTVEVTERATDGRGDFEPEVSASRLADSIFGEPGANWYSAIQCQDGEADPAYLTPDAMTKFGLGAEDCPSSPTPDALILSLDKLRDLSKGSVDEDPANGHVDYEEARRSLDLDVSAQDFHLRSWPLLPDLDRTLANGLQDENLRIAYLGAYNSVVLDVTKFVVDLACGKIDGASSVEVWADVHNNGTTSAAFEVVFSVPLSSQTVEIRRHTAPLAAGATLRVSATLPKSSDWSWASTPQVTINVNDAARFLSSCTVSFSGTTMTSASEATIYSVKAESLQNLLTGSIEVKIFYDAYRGTGQHQTITGWTLLLESSLGLPLDTDLNLNPRGWETLTVALAGAHTVKLKSALGAILDQNLVNVDVTALPIFTPTLATQVTYQPQAAVVPEAAFLAALSSQFLPFAFGSTYTNSSLPYAAGGDVYPSIYGSVQNDLAPQLIDDQGNSDPADDVPTLDTYNVLVIGSTIVHERLNSVAFRNAVRDWAQAGGLLIVFGSDAQDALWLEPIFFSALATAGSGLSTPDPSHPVLRSPNALDFTSYDTGSVAWSFTRTEDGDHFTHIIEAGDGDALSLSEPGGVGDGTVLLTSFQPWDLQGVGSTGDCDPVALVSTCEALRFLHNLLTLAYRELYLDFGPEMPTNERVASVTRLAIVPHRELDSDIELIIQVTVF